MNSSPLKFYTILDAEDRPVVDQAAGTAHEAMATARATFPQLASRMRVAVPKTTPELTKTCGCKSKTPIIPHE